MNPNEELFREGVSFIKYLFDIEDLYEEQEVVINEFFYSKRNIFLSAGTGFGKSLVYQALPIINDYVTGYAVGSSCILVVSPLIALMDDQVRQCEARGIAAVALHSIDEITNKLRDIEERLYSVVYLSPEAALSKGALRKLLESRYFREQCIGLAIDEAHLVAKW